MPCFLQVSTRLWRCGHSDLQFSLMIFEHASIIHSWRLMTSAIQVSRRRRRVLHCASIFSHSGHFPTALTSIRPAISYFTELPPRHVSATLPSRSAPPTPTTASRLRHHFTTCDVMIKCRATTASGKNVTAHTGKKTVTTNLNTCPRLLHVETIEEVKSTVTGKKTMTTNLNTCPRLLHVETIEEGKSTVMDGKHEHT